MPEAIFTKEMKQGTLRVERRFDASIERVWAAHTERNWLEEWWAPQPWRAVTVEMDFREGGRWFYYMLGPEGERHYCIQTYEVIEPGKSFAGDDYFCDENGVKKEDMPVSHWRVELMPEGESTRMTTTVRYAKPEDLKQVLEMGMEAGYTMGLNQLEALLAK